MTRRVLFNGTTLVRAGGASKVDVSAFQNVGITGVGIVAVVGEADRGEPSVVKAFSDPRAVVAEYGSGPLADAADLAFNPMNDERVPGGAQLFLCAKVNASTQASADLLASAVAQMELTSKQYGLDENKITYELSTSGTGKIIEFTKAIEDLTETSPVLGADAEFTLTYTGDATTATVTIAATGLTTTLAGDQTDGSDDLDIDFTDFSTLNQVLDYINGQIGYTAVAVNLNPYSFASVNLDYITTQDITTAYGVKAELWRIIEWVNDNSSLVTATRSTGVGEGTGVPDDVGPLYLTGGTRGTSDNTAWQNGFDLLKLLKVNIVVPLADRDLSDVGQGSTATFDSISAMADSHNAYMSSTAGKGERQGWIGMYGTKTELLEHAKTRNSAHTLLVGQYVTRANAAGNQVMFPAWGMAVIGAGGRAGSSLGEPLTYKYIRANAVTQDASWEPFNDGADMLLGGVTFAFADLEAGGFKFDKVLTTYLKSDNDAYAEESIVMGWKNVSYGLRTQLEQIYTGRKAKPATRENMEESAKTILSSYRDEEQIVDSILEDGSTLLAYREVRVSFSGDISYISAIISPVSGINYQLNTLFAVPATIAA